MEAVDLEFRQGSTFQHVVLWETLPIHYKAITGITRAAPCVVTCVGHGIPNGWRAAVVSTKGMDQLKAAKARPKETEYHTVTVLTADTVELNDVNAADFTAYVSGGYLQFYSPSDLTGYIARMTMKNRVGGDVLASLTTTNGRIIIDPTTHSITLVVSATDTAAFDWTRGVYDLEVESPAGEVTPLLGGTVTVIPEITT